MSTDPNGALPPWRSVLVVVAHPDDESFGLGALISSFVDQGAEVSVLCLTHGEASTLHGVEGDLRDIRERELADAARALGVGEVTLLDLPDGGLAGVDVEVVAGHVAASAQQAGADGLLTFDVDGVTGHPDHVQATAAAVLVGRRLGVDVLAWTVPVDLALELRHEFDADFRGRHDVDLVVAVDRDRQIDAVRCHPSQAVPGSVLWRRLELTGGHEHLRWLHRTAAGSAR